MGYGEPLIIGCPGDDDELHRPARNHGADTGDGIKQVINFRHQQADDHQREGNDGTNYRQRQMGAFQDSICFCWRVTRKPATIIAPDRRTNYHQQQHKN